MEIQSLSIILSYSDPAVDPGGRLDPPSLSPVPLLHLQVRPHVQPYLDEDGTGALIIDAMVHSLDQHVMERE